MSAEWCTELSLRPQSDSVGQRGRCCARRGVACEANFVEDKSLLEGFPVHICLERKRGLYGSPVGQQISLVQTVCQSVCCR